MYYLMVGESYNPIPFSFKIPRSFCVQQLLFRQLMIFAIYFNN